MHWFVSFLSSNIQNNHTTTFEASKNGQVAIFALIEGLEDLQIIFGVIMGYQVV